MMLLTLCEKEFSSTGSEVCTAISFTASRATEQRRRTHLATLKGMIIRQVEDVLDQLRHGVSTDPEEDVLAVFDEEETVSFESFGGQRESGRKLNAFVADDATLYICSTSGVRSFACRTHLSRHVVKGEESRMEVRDEELRGHRGDERLSVGAQVRRDLRALPQADLC